MFKVTMNYFMMLVFRIKLKITRNICQSVSVLIDLYLSNSKVEILE